jgi:hypothetical protein
MLNILDVKENHLKMTWSFDLTPVRMAIIIKPQQMLARWGEKRNISTLLVGM